MSRVTLDGVKSIVEAVYDDTVEMIKKVNIKAVHENRTVLDKLTEDVEGKPLYNGNPIAESVSGSTTNISSEANNMIVIKDDGIYAKDYSTNIADLEKRSAIGQRSGFADIRVSKGAAAIAGRVVEFDTLYNGSGIDVDLVNYTFTLKQDVDYLILPHAYNNDSSTNMILQIIDSDDNNIGQFSSSTITSIPVYNPPILFTPRKKDAVCRVIVSGTNRSPYIVRDLTRIVIIEVGRTYIIDPLAQQEEHVIDRGYFTMSAKQTTGLSTEKSIVLLNTNSGGNIKLVGNTIPLKANKEYNITFMVSVAGTVNNPTFSMYNDTTQSWIGPELYAFSVAINSTANCNGSVTFKYKPTNDCTITLRTKLDSIGSALTYTTPNIIMPYATAVVVDEVAQPTICEYNHIYEVSNPLTNGKIIGDTPVGSTINYISTTTPEHYLPCDGSIYNITDYQELAEYIKTQRGSYNYYGGDGITTFAVPTLNVNRRNVTPIMTSNNTPFPYVVTSNNAIGESAWRAFSGTNTDHVDNWRLDKWSGWVTIDCGSKRSITEFSITSYNSNQAIILSPGDFKLLGSLDGDVFNELYDATNQIWKQNETKYYELSNEVSYRYYRISISNNSGNHRYETFIGQIGFYLRDSSNYIKAEATHYAVNQYGGFQEDILFEGNVSVNDTVCTLSYDYNYYDNIYIECAYSGVINLIPVKVDTIVPNTKVGLQVLGFSSVDVTGRGIFPTRNTFKLTDSAGNITVTKIIGVKGTIPTFIEGGNM